MAKRPLLGSHQRSWIWGRNLVAETLRAGTWTPYELRLAEDAGGELRRLAESRGVAVHVEPSARLTQLCGAADHQGVLAKMPPFPYADAADLLRRNVLTREGEAPAEPPSGASEVGGRSLDIPHVGRPPTSVALTSESGAAETSPPRAEAPFFLLTDHLQDPYNFGAIVRSAECFGAAGVFIPTQRQVGVTSQVARSSAGAVNHVPIARVDDLPALADELKRRGVRLVAASEHAATPLHEADLSGPVAVVIGNEGVGIGDALLTKCDLAVAIPLAGRVGSLNAAVAAGIVIYEAARQR